jgi:hypothetical protein
MKKFYEAELIPAIPAPEFYRIHALPDEMQSQSAGLHVFECATTQFCAVHILAPILQYDFECFPTFSTRGSLDAAEDYFDGPVGVTGVGVANDIRQRFVDPEHHGPAFRLGESQPLCELRHRAAHCAEHLRVATQFHS